ncbi:MAG: bifunctional demethylmenaquinone methyltransferase/2-methoxy-6-polyprenyl-1,4-benzoquinol methylase UbiE [Pikeienuella sp.]|uniref:bifunctional demethylmenaquinone methyltransferase/2-methoxy-6-polyprenyl-1,4-benzoquinol methylase UbiE n=1 Tax=Pikeienuella sp. TaxID=2831957 RepID=UPI00391A2FA7
MTDERETGESRPTTHFGFRDVAEGEKAGLVHGVFSSVASKYDVMNDVMSFRIHRLWKEALIDWMAPRPGMKLLDVAGGTGDVSFRVLDRLKGEGEATICDMTAAMLVEGRKRAEAESLSHALTWVCGDAMKLPFPDRSFDAYTIAFGIRNVTRIGDALREAWRVLKPGGRFLCLEFSRVDPPLMRKAYDLYSFHVIPRMGQAIAGDRDSYQYLVESIRKFPDQEAFAGMIREAGFGRVSYRNQTLGVAAIHSGWRL